MSILRAVALGTAATAVLVYVLAGALALVAATGGGSLGLAAGPVLFLEVEQGDDGAAIALGSGLLLLAIVGGLLNGVAGVAMRRRDGHDRDRVP